MAVETNVTRKAVWGWRLAIVALALAAGPSCGDLTKQGKSASYLIIENLRGAPGFTPDELSNTLQSDVQTQGSPYEDVGEVVMRLALKDPGLPSVPLTPSVNNYITVTRYRVEFRREIGRNTPGVDVPYPFDGATTFTVVGGTTGGSFILVRAQAKLEAPLLALRGLGGALVISTIAEVTFYGHDQTGVPVSATGAISVNFADWADPEG